MGFVEGDKIAVWLPLGSVEYAAILFAAARIGAKVVVIDPPQDSTACDLESAKSVLLKHQPKAFILWGDYGLASVDEAGATGLIPALFPETAEDSSVKAAFTKLTARKKPASTDMPFLKYVVHTGQTNIRGALTFRNLLFYQPILNGMGGSVDAKGDFLINGSSGKSLSQVDIINAAKACGRKLKLSGDQSTKAGKLVAKTSAIADGSMIEALTAALMHESLFISPSLDANDERTESTVKSENAMQL